MGDQLPSGIAVDITWVEGEILSAAKLTAVSAQLRRGLSQVEAAIGDIHNESYPYTSASDTTLSQSWGKNVSDGTDLSGSVERQLDIANLARLIGPASNLNPKTASGSRIVIEDVPIGVYEFSLRWPVSGVLSATTTTDPAMITFVSSPADLLGEGDNTWTVSRGGKVRTADLTQGGTISYTIDPLEWDGGLAYSGASFNVIPDPNQTANGLGVSIGVLDGNGRRLVTLPLITHQQSNISQSSITLNSTDPNFQEQLKLPRILNTNLIAGDEIPYGFLYLRNDTTHEVYEDGVYYWNDSDSIHVGNVDLTDAINASNVFSVITIGTDITTSIDDLRNKTYHNHDRTHGEPYVDVRGIVGQYQEAGLSGPYTASDMPSNYFSQYLHRDGYRGSVDNNLNDNNAMRGDLVMGVDVSTAGGYVNPSIGDTFGVFFGGRSASDPFIVKTDFDLVINAGTVGETRVELDNADPNLDASNALRVVNGPIKAEQGFRFPTGTFQGTNVGIFATQGTCEAPDGNGDGFTKRFITTGTVLADVEDKFWLDVRLNLHIQDGVPVTGASGSDIDTTGFYDDCVFPPSLEEQDALGFDWEYFWRRNGSTTELFFTTSGTNWLTAPSLISFSIVIFYIP